MLTWLKLPKWLIVAGATVLGVAIGPVVGFIVNEAAPKIRDSLFPPPPRRIIATLQDYTPSDRDSAQLIVERPADRDDRVVEVGRVRWQDNSRVVFGPATADWYVLHVEAMSGGTPHRIERTVTAEKVTTEVAFPSRASAQSETGWHPKAQQPTTASVPSPTAHPKTAPALPDIPAVPNLADLRKLLGKDFSEGDRWLSIALLEIGVAEGDGANSNPRIEDYFTSTPIGRVSDKTPWSGAFVSWVLTQSGIISGTGSARNADWLGFGTELLEPKRGALAVLRPLGPGSSGHVGFVVERRENCVLLVSGNVHNRVGLDCFPLSTVRSYRWPKL